MHMTSIGIKNIFTSAYKIMLNQIQNLLYAILFILIMATVLIVYTDYKPPFFKSLVLVSLINMYRLNIYQSNLV